MEKAGNTFQKQCDKYTRLDFFSYLSTDSDSALLALIDTLSGYDQVIVAAHLKEIRPSAKYSLTNNNIKALGQFSLLPKAVLCIFGNVYAINKLNDIQNYKALILAYQQWKYSEEAAAQILFGGLPSKGSFRLPSMTLCHRILVCCWLKAPCMSYGLPAQVGFDERLETRIDSIVMAGLEDRAYPEQWCRW